jgi:hypothetical protein
VKPAAYAPSAHSSDPLLCCCLACQGRAAALTRGVLQSSHGVLMLLDARWGQLTACLAAGHMQNAQQKQQQKQQQQQHSSGK